jgi:hypothetical protein
MIVAFSHNAMKPGQQKRFAAVQGRSSVSAGDGHVRAVYPPDARGLEVSHIRSVVNAAKVRYAVVRDILVDVIDFSGLGAVMEKPRHAMRQVFFGVDGDAKIATVVATSGRHGANLASEPVRRPNNGARFRVVPKTQAGRVGDWLGFHLASMPDRLRKSYHEW